jgi:hypothetical protein
VNIVLYALCMLLLLPVAGLAAFALVIESLAAFGVWSVFRTLFFAVGDPLGDGLPGVTVLAVLAGLGMAGLFDQTRQAGFACMAAAGTACGIYVLRRYTGFWDAGAIAILLPSLAGICLSAFFAARPPN